MMDFLCAAVPRRTGKGRVYRNMMIIIFMAGKKAAQCGPEKIGSGS